MPASSEASSGSQGMKTATTARAAPTATPTSIIWMIERFRTESLWALAARAEP